MINSVYGIKRDDLFLNEGNLFKITDFPTRNMVCGKLVHENFEPAPQDIKISIHYVNRAFALGMRKSAKINKETNSSHC